MRDQAEKLRMKMLELDGALGKSIAIVSGKGGVGKSNFTTNFANLLSKEGKKVAILDMDIGMGNIHILLGMSVQYSLKDYLDGSATIEEVLIKGPNNVHYVSGGSGMSSLLEWNEKMFDSFIRAYEHIQKEFDFILLDMGAGATNWTLELLTLIEEIIVISTAEPTAIMDAYSMMKYIYLKDSEKTFYVLCNSAFNQEEGKDTTDRLAGAMKKFMSKEVVVLGVLPQDPVVRKAVREQIPFSELYPDAPITKALKKIVNRFIYHQTEEVVLEKASSGFLSKFKRMFSKGRD